MFPAVSRVLIAFIVLIKCHAALSQRCAVCRYISPQFDSVTVETVRFGRGPVFGGRVIDLYMDIYQPYGDTATNRVAAVFAFGGAFVTGSRDDWYVVLACTELAKAGFVVAAIDYRIYNDLTEMIAEISLLQHQRIFFRPMQDMRAAVQYLKADFAELGNNYRIDTSRILIGGASSGAMTSLMTAYCDKESEMAEMLGGSVAPLDDLGGFYSTSGFYPNYSWKALATFNVSGSLVNAGWVEEGDIPIILAHGDADRVVPYKNGSFIPPFFDMQGSYTIDSVARAKGVCSYLYTMAGKDHPSEDIGIDYLKSVVYRMMLHMHAVIHQRSFCCEMELKVNPLDTVHYEAEGEPVCLAACTINDSGDVRYTWCGLNCLPFESASPVITVQPDTNLRYIACLAYAGACQAVSLNMVKEGIPVACDTPAECKSSSATMRAHPETSLLVYPQPASNRLTVAARFPHIMNSGATIEIFDIAGRKIFSRDVFMQDRMTEVIETRAWTAGSYFIEISAPKIYVHQKLVLIK